MRTIQQTELEANYHSQLEMLREKLRAKDGVMFISFFFLLTTTIKSN